MKRLNKTSLIYTILLVLLSTTASADDGCTKDNPYPPSLVKSFMTGCVSKPDFKDFCECTISKLQSNMPLYDFVEIGNTSNTALQKDARFTESTNACLSKIKAPVEQEE